MFVLDVLLLDVFGLDPFFVDLEMAELDSMATVGFVLDLEREFGIKVSDRDAARLKTFGDVVEYVHGASRSKAA